MLLSTLLRRRLGALLLAALALAPAALAQAPAPPPPITVVNQSYPTRCAEEDNVFLTLAAPRLEAFRVEALHPAYIGAVIRDSYAPDFTDCNFGPTPPPEGPFFTPRQFVMWENADYVMVANTDQHFWRKKDVPVRVGNRVEHNIHLIQFYRKRADGRRDQVLVIYPVDGHWRTKPLPVPHLDYNVYGASFLVGPVEAEDRRKPFVDYSEVAFDPATLTFNVRFDRGGGAAVRVMEVSQRATSVEVALTPGTPLDRPFAALRSMYVTADNADIGNARSLLPDGREELLRVVEFRRAEVGEITFARSVVSRHNTSAPDKRFAMFR